MAYTPPPNPSPMNIDVKDVLFVDFETVPSTLLYEEANPRARELFHKKYRHDLVTVENDPEGWAQALQSFWEERAAMTAEHAKIVCAAVGVIVVNEEGTELLRLKSFSDDDETALLMKVGDVFRRAKVLCAHNGKRFDYPMFIRRCLILGLPIPPILQVSGLKPWEVMLFDTMEMWGFTDLRATVSLDALAYAFGLPSPKDGFSGADVAKAYYGPHELPWEKEDATKKIADYCMGDVATLANCYLRMIQRPPIDPTRFVYA